MRFSIFILVITNILYGCHSARYTQKENSSDSIKVNIEPNSSTSPYSILIEQPDGTKIEVIGKGNMNAPYTETIDGYTILRNKDGIYEYAILGVNERLRPSGIKAQNVENRTKKEKEFLETIEKHLRNHYQ